MKKREDLKILLMQIREDEITLQEEIHEFMRYGDLEREQITLLNVFNSPDFASNIIDDYDALFVGGSSDASVIELHAYPFVSECKGLMRYCFDNDVPVFASCFGFQLAIEEFGGSVILDKDNMEMGIYEIFLNDAASDDPLLCDTPKSFYAVSGHKERANKIPNNAIALGHSQLCPFHIVRLKDKPFYCFQIHPEVDRDDLIKRITRYRKRYFEDEAELQRMMDHSVQPTPHANALVKKFIDRFVLQ